MDITMKSKASNVTASCVAHLDIKLWRIFFFLSSVTNWRNKYINVLSHYLTSVALCFSDSKKGQWRPDSPSAVYQWKSNIVHKQGSGNQYFITKLLVRMKKNSRSFLAASSVRVAVSSMSGPRWRAGPGAELGGRAGLRHSSCKHNNNNNTATVTRSEHSHATQQAPPAREMAADGLCFIFCIHDKQGHTGADGILVPHPCMEQWVNSSWCWGSAWSLSPFLCFSPMSLQRGVPPQSQPRTCSEILLESWTSRYPHNV